MAFTLTFIELFFLSLYLILPLLISLSALIILLGYSASIIEKWSTFDGLYWALITATTVGYGDIKPVKKITKILSIVIALTGMILTGIIIAVALNTASISLDKHIDPKMIESIKDRLNTH